MAHIFKKLTSLFLVVTLSVGLMNCGDHDGDVGDSVNNNYFDDVYTLQGVILDATTGARLGDASTLEVYLIQGTSNRTPTKLITDNDSILVGEYAFDNIPITVNAGNVTYKVVVAVDGYQHFEGTITNTAAFGAGAINNNVDDDYNLIRDIYLFPLGATAPDYEVIVEYDFEPVEGVTVVLQQNINNNEATVLEGGAGADVVSNRLPASAGLLPTLTGTTDEDGSVVFSGDNLVLGGQYTPIALPFTYEGVATERTNGNAFVVGGDANAGTDLVTQVIAVDDLNPGANALQDGLYAVFASNNDPNDITSTGTLTIVFNRAIELQDDCSASLNFAGGAILEADAENQVTETVSSDGLTLTLTATYDTSPDADDVGLEVVYSCPITLDGDDEADNFDITDIDYADDLPLSATVNVIPDA